MTYTEFKTKWETEILPNKPTFIREGQALINYLGDVWMNEYERINNTENDCFHRNSLILNTWKHLEKVWNSYPN